MDTSTFRQLSKCRNEVQLPSSIARRSFPHQKADLSFPGLRWGHELVDGFKDHLDLFVMGAYSALQLNFGFTFCHIDPRSLAVDAPSQSRAGRVVFEAWPERGRKERKDERGHPLRPLTPLHTARKEARGKIGQAGSWSESIKDEG